MSRARVVLIVAPVVSVVFVAVAALPTAFLALSKCRAELADTQNRLYFAVDHLRRVGQEPFSGQIRLYDIDGRLIQTQQYAKPLEVAEQ